MSDQVFFVEAGEQHRQHRQHDNTGNMSTCNPKKRLFDVAALNDPRNLMNNHAEYRDHHREFPDFVKHRKKLLRHNCDSACIIVLEEGDIDLFGREQNDCSNFQ